jgi:hypothetical protein
MSAEAEPPGGDSSCDNGSYGSNSTVASSLPEQAGHAKEYVLSCLPHLVRQGVAEWDLLRNGEIELRFRTGETFLLGKDVVTRTA